MQLTNMTTAGSTMVGTVVQVDIEPKNFTPLASIRVASDVSAFLDDLLTRVPATGRSPWLAPVEEPPDCSVANEFAKAIASFRDATVTVDIGQHTIWTMASLRPSRPRGVLISGNYPRWVTPSPPR